MRGNREQGTGNRWSTGNRSGCRLPVASSLILAIAYCLLLLAGCGGSGSNPPANGTLIVSAQNSSGGSVSATILLNNDEKGNAPLQISDLTPGTYTLLLQSAGYTDYTSSIVVQSAQTTTLTATMETVAVPEGPVFTKRGLTPT